MRRTKDIKSQLLGAVMTALVMCVMFVCISFTSLAAEGKITTSSAKIRKEANTSCDVVGSAAYGETYDIINEVTGSDGYIWYQIAYEEDKLGYVRSDLMQKTGSTTTTTPSTSTTTEVTELQPVNCTVTGGQVNVRSNASTSGSKVAQVQAGVVMTINGQAKDSEGKTWYRVTFTSNNGDVTGFVRNDFVSVSGELVPVTEAEPPVADEPVVQEPVVQEPEKVTPVLTKDYETVEDGDVWYLIDNVEGNRYNLESVMNAAVKNPELYKEMEAKVKSQKGWIVFLVILVILMSVGIALLVLKIKDVMDEAYFSAVEKETIRQRQSQKQSVGNKSAGNKSVMHTVGSGSGSGTTIRQGSVQKTSVPKMNLEKGSSTPQTVKVSNPADTRPKPMPQRPAGERPVANPAAAKPASPKVNVQKPAAPKDAVTDETKVMPTVTREESKKAVEATKQKWQSKNFMTDDDDDEFEYGFLDWDESDE